MEKLEQLPPDNPLLAGSIRLTVAEAQLNLALGEDNQAQRLAGLAEGRRSCEHAAEQALAAGTGVACMLLPRAITLLTVLYKAAPEMHQAGLAESLQYLASRLDQKLLEQKFLRQQALRRLQTARLLLASGEGISPSEKRILYSQAASEMLDAGDLYLEAGDQAMLLQVQADLEALQKSLSDPAIPALSWPCLPHPCKKNCCFRRFLHRWKQTTNPTRHRRMNRKAQSRTPKPFHRPCRHPAALPHCAG